MADAIETTRLRLEPWSERHLTMLARLSAMPEVTRFIGDGSTWDDEGARERHDRALAHWAEHGWGWYAIAERDGGARIGVGALNRLGEGAPGFDPELVEIGWWIDPSRWRRGYASEAAQALLEEGSRLGDGRVVARIQHGNVASRGVAARLGLTLAGESRAGGGSFLVLLGGAATSPGSSPAT